MNKRTFSAIQFIIGIILLLISATLMIFDMGLHSIRLIMGIIGILLTATSKIRLLK